MAEGIYVQPFLPCHWSCLSCLYRQSIGRHFKHHPDCNQTLRKRQSDMNTPSPNTREPHKILRLIGALIIAAGSLLLLKQLILAEAPAGTMSDEHYQSMEFPKSTPPTHLIET
ncbi:MAG: hypothetical protein H6R19_1647 [Proteobacteria bacterium]|nr:hypothetical protein [Pseudomonadota bacterium]